MTEVTANGAGRRGSVSAQTSHVWRTVEEHAVVCQAVAHVPPLRQKVDQTVSRPQHGLEELSAGRLTTITQRAVGSPDAANASLYDSSGKMTYEAPC